MNDEALAQWCAILATTLGHLQDNSTELESLQKEAEDVIAKARSEASSKIQAAKKATEDDIQAAADEHKKVHLSLYSFM